MALSIGTGISIGGGISITLSGGATQQAIFGYGDNGSTYYSLTNLVSNTGVVATDTTGVGTARTGLAAASYGGDKGIFGFGTTTGIAGGITTLTNLVSNTGVVATDVTNASATARWYLAAAGFGGDQAIFSFGGTSNALFTGATNLVTNLGVMGSDVTQVGASRFQLAAASYGTDKAIFAYGASQSSGTRLSTINLVSNTGVVASNSSGSGTAKIASAAASYGGDKAILGYGRTTYGSAASRISLTNLVSNLGVVAADTTGVGTARYSLAAVGYGGDKAIFGYGDSGSYQSITNLVSNTGVVATDTTGVGTARSQLAACGFSFS